MLRDRHRNTEHERRRLKKPCPTSELVHPVSRLICPGGTHPSIGTCMTALLLHLRPLRPRCPQCPLLRDMARRQLLNNHDRTTHSTAQKVARRLRAQALATRRPSARARASRHRHSRTPTTATHRVATKMSTATHLMARICLHHVLLLPTASRCADPWKIHDRCHTAPDRNPGRGRMVSSKATATTAPLQIPSSSDLTFRGISPSRLHGPPRVKVNRGAPARRRLK
jgi:hypothetical protein